MAEVKINVNHGVGSSAEDSIGLRTHELRLAVQQIADASIELVIADEKLHCPFEECGMQKIFHNGGNEASLLCNKYNAIEAPTEAAICAAKLKQTKADATLLANGGIAKVLMSAAQLGDKLERAAEDPSTYQ